LELQTNRHTLPQTKIMSIEIYDTDTWKQVADKIWSDGFQTNQSCSIYGIELINGKAVAKGELVVEELRRLDKEENVMVGQSGKKSRRRKILPDSIGGYVAHKIFRFKYNIIIDEVKGNTVKYNIWRVQ